MSDWRIEGACRGHKPHEFIPDDTGNGDLTADVHWRALKICARCPVTKPCLEYALENREDFGVWGNTTPRQRRTIREQRKALSVSRTDS